MKKLSGLVFGIILLHSCSNESNMQIALRNKILEENIWIHSQLNTQILHQSIESRDTTPCDCAPSNPILSYTPGDTSLIIPQQINKQENIIAYWRDRLDRRRVKKIMFIHCDTIHPELVRLFPDIQSISLNGGNKYIGISGFKKVKKLHLKFCYNEIPSDEIKKMHGLKILHLHHSILKENTLRHLTQLEEIKSNASQLGSIADLNKLSKLRILEIRRLWKITDNRTLDLSNLKCLKKLVLNENPKSMVLPKGIELLELETLKYDDRNINYEDRKRLNTAIEKIRTASFEKQKSTVQPEILQFN